VRNKLVFIVIAVLSLGAILWLPSSNPALPISENAKSTFTRGALYSPPTEAKPTPAATIGIKSETQPEFRDKTALESPHEARSEGDDTVPEVTSTSEELAEPEHYNEYETRGEMQLENAYLEPENSEMQNIKQQLQAMREAGLDEAAMHDAEEKLVQLQEITQRLRDQQSISKAENDSAEDGSDFLP